MKNFFCSLLALLGACVGAVEQPEYLYKIVSPEEWEESQRQNQVVKSAMDADFIHLATKEQVPRIAQKFWKGREYLVLKLKTKKLEGRLVLEANPGGENRYYHLYEGKIPLDAVENIEKQ
jgi:uncharacterized protein (DUF952 family)